MGRGNFCPCGDMTFQWYVDYDNYRYDEYEDEHYEGIDYELAEDEVQMALDQMNKKYPSFKECDEWKDSYWGQEVRLKNKLLTNM